MPDVAADGDLSARPRPDGGGGRGRREAEELVRGGAEKVTNANEQFNAGKCST